MVSRITGHTVHFPKCSTPLEEMLRRSPDRRAVRMVAIADALRNRREPHGLHTCDAAPVMDYMESYMRTRERVRTAGKRTSGAVSLLTDSLQYSHLFMLVGPHILRQSVRK